MEVRMPSLEAKGLRKAYSLGEHMVQALRGVDSVVEKSQFIANMGPSGSS